MSLPLRWAFAKGSPDFDLDFKPDFKPDFHIHPGKPFKYRLPEASIAKFGGGPIRASLPDGSPLPSWLHFDKTFHSFSGTPPRSAHFQGSLLLKGMNRQAGSRKLVSFLEGKKDCFEAKGNRPFPGRRQSKEIKRVVCFMQIQAIAPELKMFEPADSLNHLLWVLLLPWSREVSLQQWCLKHLLGFRSQERPNNIRVFGRLFPTFGCNNPPNLARARCPCHCAGP